MDRRAVRPPLGGGSGRSDRLGRARSPGGGGAAPGPPAFDSPSQGGRPAAARGGRGRLRGGPRARRAGGRDGPPRRAAPALLRAARRGRPPPRRRHTRRERAGGVHAAVRTAGVRLGSDRRRRCRPTRPARHRGARMRRDGTVLVGLIALLVVGAVVLAPGLGGNGPDFQPAGRGPYGLSGLAAGLQASGVAVSVRNRPTLAGRLSVIVEPQYVSHDEAAAW